MSTIDPFIPHPDREETIAAADPGVGAPATAPGLGVESEAPDVTEPDPDVESGGDGGVDVSEAQDVPFRTPDPRELQDDQ